MDGKPDDQGDGYELYKFHNDTFHGNITIPTALGTWLGTTYVYRGFHPPSHAKAQSCGSRCMHVWAHRSKGKTNDEQIYQCPITVTNVTDVTDEATQSLSDGMARLAATSIALQGRFSGGGKGWAQYQLYPFE